MWNSMWRQARGRGGFSQAALLLCSAIFALPILTGIIVFGLNGGARSERATVLAGLATQILFLVLMVPLVVVTRQRLRDLQLSGVFLYLFPIWPLLSLTSLALVPFAAFGPAGQMFLWRDLVLGLGLAIVLAAAPGPDADSRHAALDQLRRLTDCEARMGRWAFWRSAAGPALLLLLLSAALPIPLVFLRYGLSPAHWPPAWLAGFALLTAGQGLLALLLIAPVVRRLHDLGFSGLVSLLFPTAAANLLAILAPLGTMMAMPDMLASRFLGFPHLGLLAIYAPLPVGLILLAWLLLAPGQAAANRWGPAPG